MKIINPGPLTTIQDAGRHGYMAMGFPVSGAADPIAYRIANMLLGNDPGAAVLEITLGGLSAIFEEHTVIAFTGADMAPTVNGKAVPLYTSREVHPGDKLSTSFAATGCRAYLAIGGGIDAPIVMGSRSVNHKCGIGSKLAADDRVTVLPGAPFRARRATVPEYDHTVRVIRGPQADCFTKDGMKTFLNSEYAVTPFSDRMGCRFLGKTVSTVGSADIISDGIPLGGIQIASDGQPIIMLADRQTTGGYAKIATVITADLPNVAQLRPGDKVRFRAVSLGEALNLWKEQLKLGVIDESIQ